MSNRLVTVVGPAGVGKTALARAAAERLASRYALGVRVVDLTRVDDEAVVPGTIAQQLGFDSFDALLSSPNDRPVLLLVDNCEHLLDAVASAVVQVLGACNQPTVVATSRAPLEVPGESIVSLAPLAVPTGDGDPRACPSVQLFLERCRDAGATVTDDDLADVVDLCRRLDGLPLAIEIAAARARTMGVAEITARLSKSVDVLERPRFRGDPRHRSVADTIRWSYGLLARRQAELLEQLGVFAGPFTAASARSIVVPAEVGTVDADLDELVNVCLVAVDAGGPETRYRLLDTVRRFALDQLRRRDEMDATYDRFVDHVVESVQRMVAGASVTWRPDIVTELVTSFDDIAEALRWCIAHDTEPGARLPIVRRALGDRPPGPCRRRRRHCAPHARALARRRIAAGGTGGGRARDGRVRDGPSRARARDRDLDHVTGRGARASIRHPVPGARPGTPCAR